MRSLKNHTGYCEEVSCEFLFARYEDKNLIMGVSGEPKYYENNG